MPNLVVFSGSAHPQFAQKVVSHLHIPLGAASIGQFSDGEIAVEITENVRGKDVFIVQPTCAPTDDNLMEILVMADALRRASAGRITAVIPYFGYARQDRRPRSSRVPITAKVVADMLTTVGIDRVVMIDLHADQIQGFFDVPVDNVYGSPVLLDDIRQQFDIAESDAIRTGFYRSNLTLQFVPASAEERDTQLRYLLRQQTPGPTIIYVTQQRTADILAAKLADEQFSARAYHAGLEAEARARLQDWFMQSEEAIMVATIAFGMGIDKSDIRYVYHYNLPKSLES